jgi:DNA-binding CsgD family transcriptional regulator
MKGPQLLLASTASCQQFQVFEAGQILSWLSEVVEANDQAWLLVDSQCRILFETRLAVRWLIKYFGHNGSLPDQLRDWLKRHVSGLRNSNPSVLASHFSIQRGSTLLTVKLLSPAKSGEQRLLLTESDQEVHAGPLQALGLTQREAEVLLWISQGKRNAEIAAILAISERTVGKHVERILHKLSVETRTAAATTAFHLLERLGTKEQPSAP